MLIRTSNADGIHSYNGMRVFTGAVLKTVRSSLCASLWVVHIFWD